MTANATNATNATPAARKVSMVKYNQAVRTARTAATRAGLASWIIGDAALAVTTEYGDKTMQRFADDISVEVTTVRNYRTMASRYPETMIRRDLQPPTVYGIFVSQTDAFNLITDGNDGQPWTVSAARDLVKSRKATPAAAGTDDNDNDGNDGGDTAETDTAKLARLRIERDRLAAELAKTDALIAALELKVGPATHIVRGLPEHTADAHRTDCHMCTVLEPAADQDAPVTPITAGRKSRRASQAA